MWWVEIDSLFIVMLRFLRLQIGMIVILFLLLAQWPSASAQLDEVLCEQQMHASLQQIMLGGGGLRGYVQRLGDLTSSSLATAALLDEVQQMARDARIEMRGLCRAISAPDKLLSEAVAAAYQVDSCRNVLSSGQGDVSVSLQLAVECSTKSDVLMDQFLDRLSAYLLKQAVRTSSEPLVLQMRSLNARLQSLVPEYGRLVNHFFTFSFRLGDVIISQPD